ncbi:MAG: hypothetical protein ACE366_03240 [Bradymonadia bacterium]
MSRNTHHWCLLVGLVATLAACPAPDPPPNNQYPSMSDAISDVRALIPGLGGHDPHTGVPIFGEGACRIVDEPLSGDGREEVRTYDDEGRLLTRQTGVVGEPAEFTWRIEWGADGLPTVFSSQYQDFAPNEMDIEHDGDGVLVKVDQRGRDNLWVYTYAEGRIAQLDFQLDAQGAEGFRLEYTYDSEGQLVSKQAWKSWGIWIDVAYDYDDQGQLSRKTFIDALEEGDIVEHYVWRDGRVVGVSRPLEGWSDSIEYDSAGRIETMSRTYVPKIDGEPAPDAAYVSRIRRFEWGCRE